MHTPLRFFGLTFVSVAALATAACSPAPSGEAPPKAAAAEGVALTAAANTAAGTPSPASSEPALIKALAAAPNGLATTSNDAQALFASVYGPDDCAGLGPESEGPELPFERYCVWPRDPGGSNRLEVLTGIIGDRVVSVALIGHPGALPDWDCTPAPDAPNTELCVAAGTPAADAAQWNTAWNNFVAVFVTRP